MAQDSSFYFLEVNTRLQSYHPATDSSRDLSWFPQLLVAGKPYLPRCWTSPKATHRNALYPIVAPGFSRSSAALISCTFPGSTTSGWTPVHLGFARSTFYDPMLGEVIGYGRYLTRRAAGCRTFGRRWVTGSPPPRSAGRHSCEPEFLRSHRTGYLGPILPSCCWPHERCRPQPHTRPCGRRCCAKPPGAPRPGAPRLPGLRHLPSQDQSVSFTVGETPSRRYRFYREGDCSCRECAPSTVLSASVRWWMPRSTPRRPIG